MTIIERIPRLLCDWVEELIKVETCADFIFVLFLKLILLCVFFALLMDDSRGWSKGWNKENKKRKVDLNLSFEAFTRFAFLESLKVDEKLQDCQKKGLKLFRSLKYFITEKSRLIAWAIWIILLTPFSLINFFCSLSPITSKYTCGSDATRV